MDLKETGVRDSGFFVGLWLAAHIFLSGCTGDPGAPPESPNQPWRVTAEIVSATTRLKLVSIRSERTDGQVDANDFLEFPSLRDHDFNAQPVTIDVISSCEGKGVDSFRTIRNSAAVPLRALLPLTAAARPLNPEGDLVCSFAFSAKNHLGSLNTFKMIDVRITAPLSEAGLALAAPAALHPRTWRNNKISLSDLEAATLTRTPGNDAPLSLACEEFTVQTHDDKPSVDDLKTLAQAAARALTLGLQGKSRLAEQVCRLVAYGKSTADASAYFVLRLTTPRVSFVVQPQFVSLDGDLHHEVRLLSMTIKNSDDAPRWIVVPPGGAGSLSLRLFSYFPSPIGAPVMIFNLAPARSGPIAWRFPLPTQSLEGGAEKAAAKVFELAAHASATLEIVQATRDPCLLNFTSGVYVAMEEELRPQVLLRPFNVGDSLRLLQVSDSISGELPRRDDNGLLSAYGWGPPGQPLPPGPHPAVTPYAICPNET